MLQQTIPSSLQSILWSSNIKKLNVEKDKTYIIHQTLAYGDIQDIKWLFATYPRTTVEHIFTSTPYKDYRRSRFYFIKDVVMDLAQKTLLESSYVKNIPRNF